MSLRVPPLTLRRVTWGTNREVEHGRTHQAADARVERRGQRAHRHKLRIRGGETARDPAHRAHQATIGHRRAWVVEADEAGDERRADHHQHGLEHARGDGKRHHGRVRPQRRARHRAHGMQVIAPAPIVVMLIASV